MRQALNLLKGSFAIALIHRDYPDQIIAMTHECPLAIGVGNGEAFISSDTNAFIAHTRKAVYLANSEIAIVKADGFKVYNESAMPVIKKRVALHRPVEISKGNFEHYMLKEIHEQPQAIRNALLSRFLHEYGTATLEEISLDVNDFMAVKRILI